MANTPIIRFKGFTYDWEQRKLGEVFKQTQNFVNPSDDNIELWSLTVEDGLTPKSERYNREFLVKKDDNFKEVRPGDIVYNPMNMTLGAVGYNGMAKSVAVSGYYTTMVTRENYDSYYINTWLKSPQAILLYKTYATGSLIEKQRVQFPTLSIIPVAFPNYVEQRKIGEFFSNLDNLITLHQRKCDETKTLKKYMLQKMFPKNGECFPEIRFAGFTDAWEQRKCGDMTIELSEYDNLQSGYPLLTSSRNGLMFQNEFRDKTSTENEETMFSVVPYGKCTYRHMSDDDIFHFNINTIAEKGLVSREYPVFDANEDCNLSFLIQYLNSSPDFTKFCSQRKLGGTRTRLYYKNLCEFSLMAPSKAEQDKIAAFLERLDNLITLHQRKCDELKEVKKYMLQNMFPAKE